MKSIKISTRILGTFGVLVLLLVVVVAMALMQLRSMRSSAETITGNALPSVEVINTLNTDLARTRLLELRHVNNDEPGYMAQVEAQFEQLQKHLADAKKLYEPLIVTAEERELYARMAGSEHRAVFEAFLQRKRDLEDEERALAASLAEHEETLAAIRARLANPPASVLPADPAKASLYIAWKRALAEREELLRQARKRKHDLLRDLKARFETQVVLLEMERRSAVDGLRASVEAERAKVEVYKKDLAAMEESIDAARGAMKKFKAEFEQLRVGLLIDRMAKSTQVQNLAERRARLAREAEQFKDAIEAARARVAKEESAKWEAKLAAEKEAGERRVADERKLIEQKIEQVRTALAERYESGFRPLLREAETRHLEQLHNVAALQVRRARARACAARKGARSARARTLTPPPPRAARARHVGGAAARGEPNAARRVGGRAGGRGR